MTGIPQLNTDITGIFNRYHGSFVEKVYNEENNDHDLLMDVFGVTPELKRENRQYWGRELGMCWQLLVTEVFRQTREDFGPAIRVDEDEPCDLTVGTYAIDTKYRIGSGDSGTLKKFKAYGPLLRERGYEPVFLILREDNLPAAISACLTGGWTVYTADRSYDFIQELTGVDLRPFLTRQAGAHPVLR